MVSALDRTPPGTEVLPRISAWSLGPSITAVFSWAGRGVHQIHVRVPIIDLLMSGNPISSPRPLMPTAYWNDHLALSRDSGEQVQPGRLYV